MQKNYYYFIKSKNLLNRIFDMLDYFNIFEKYDLSKNDAKDILKENINNPIFIETILKYFCDKFNNNQKRIELRCNLHDLINDLNYLKQYLEKDY